MSFPKYINIYREYCLDKLTSRLDTDIKAIAEAYIDTLSGFISSQECSGIFNKGRNKLVFSCTGISCLIVSYIVLSPNFHKISDYVNKVMMVNAVVDSDNIISSIGYFLFFQNRISQDQLDFILDLAALKLKNQKAEVSINLNFDNLI